MRPLTALSVCCRTRTADDNRPPEYDDDNPPPYTAPGLPPSAFNSTSRTGSSKSSQWNQSQEYVEPTTTAVNANSNHTSGQRAMMSSRSKSESTYSRSAGSDVNSFKRSATGPSGRSLDQFDEELPIYNAGGGATSEMYTADDRRYNSNATSRAGPSRSASDISSKKANKFTKGLETPYDLETDYHGFSDQSQLAAVTSASVAHGGHGQSQYSLPNKYQTKTQQLDQYDNGDGSYYDDATSQCRQGASRSGQGQGQGQNWSAGDISGSFTDRVQGSLSLDPTSAPQLPPRKGQCHAAAARNAKPDAQRADTDDQVLNAALERMLTNDLHLRPSLLVDHVDLS